MKQIFGGAPPPGRGVGSPGGGSPSAPGGAAPTAPKLDSSGARSDSLVLSWQWPANPPQTTYELTWREANSTAPWQRQRLNINEAAFSGHVLRSLQPNTTYSIAVQSSAGPRGAELTATTAPAVPQQLEACDSTASTISLRWRPVSGSSVRYAVYGSAALSFAKVYSGVDTYCEVSGLTRGKDYGFRVCAMNAHGGASDFSPELIAKCEPSGGSTPTGGGGRSPSNNRGASRGVVPELLTLTHDALSMRWAPPAGGASNYIVELAEGEDGEVDDDEEWAVIYEGAPPGCEISYLAPSTEYHMRVAYTDHSGRTSDFGSPLIVTTPDEPEKQKKKKSPPKKKKEVKKAPPPPPPKPPPKPPAPPKPKAPPKPPATPRNSSPGRVSTGGGVTPRSANVKPPKAPAPAKKQEVRGPSPAQPPRKAAIPSPRRSAEPARTARRPPPSPRPPPSQPSPRRAARYEDTGGDSDEDDDGGQRSHRSSGMRSPRRSSSTGAIHERLYNLHQEQVAKNAEERRKVIEGLNQSKLSLSERAGAAMSPRFHESSTAFGSTGSRPHLWLGANAAAGPTTDQLAPSSPRGSRRGSTVPSQVADGEKEVPDSPGPGAYETKGGFKQGHELKKDPSKGASSAFRSKTKRLFTNEGGIIEKEVFPGVNINESPGVGTYTPGNASMIGAAAAAIKRQAEKLQRLRKSTPVPKRDSAFERDKVEQEAMPGPGAYEPGKVAKKKEERVYAAKASAFKSGTRRSLPWGGSGTSAPTSSRSRKAEVVEAEPTTVPGPGDYVLPSSFAKAKEKPRVGRKGGGSAAFAKGTQRFAAEPDPDKIMPSAVHYTPNYSYCSSRV